MVFQRQVDGFDQCEPPVCPEDVRVVIDSWSCSGGWLYVSWIVEDDYDRNLNITGNRLRWGCNETNWLPNALAPHTTDPYSTAIPVSFCTDSVEFAISFQAIMEINGGRYESEVRSVSLNECDVLGDEMVRAALCVCDTPQTPPEYNLYVNEAGVPPNRPVYFTHDGLCWYIDDEAWNNKIPVDEGLGTVINSVTEDSDIYTNCNQCCTALDCPSLEWVTAPDGSGDLIGNFYVLYNTKALRDRIVVIRNFDSATDCDLTKLHSSKIIWDSGCIGTSRTDPDHPTFPRDCNSRPCEDEGEGPGNYIADTPALDAYLTAWAGPLGSNRGYFAYGLKTDCFEARDSYLPLGISIDANCSTGQEGTWWCLTVDGPGMNPLTLCDGDEDICTDVEARLSSTSSSSSSSAEQSSSSSSSSESSSSSSSSESSTSSSSSSSSTSSSSSSSSTSSSSSSSSMNQTLCEFVYGDLPSTIDIQLDSVGDCSCGVNINNVNNAGQNGETWDVGAALNQTWTIDWTGAGTPCVYQKEFTAGTDYGDWAVYTTAGDGCTTHAANSPDVFDKLKITATVVSDGVEVEIEHWLDGAGWKDYLFKDKITGGTGYFHEGVWSTGNDWGGCECCDNTNASEPCYDGGGYDCADWYTGGASTRVKIST